MDSNVKQAAESRLSAAMTATGVTFSTTAGVSSNSQKLVAGLSIRIAEGTEPTPDKYEGRGFFRYTLFVDGQPSSLSKHTLFDGLQWIPLGDRTIEEREVEFISGEHKGQKQTLKVALVPWKELRGRNTNKMVDAVEMLSVQLVDPKDASKTVNSNVPMFVKEVTLKCLEQKALVPIFGAKSVEIDGVKHAVCELNENYIILA